MSDFLTLCADALCGPFTALLLLFTGIYFTVKTGFFQIRKLPFILRETVKTLFVFKKGGKKSTGISPFSAMSTALAGTIGTGNIVGVATAIAVGGPGAIFWLWVCAFFGMMTKYAEILLAVKFREKRAGAFFGGPMYYMEKGLHKKHLGRIFAFFCLLASLFMGNITQSNSIAGAAANSFSVSPHVSAAVICVLCAFAVFGGIKTISKTSEKLVPFMAISYLAVSILVVISNPASVPAAFSQIFKFAFSPCAPIGGFSGCTVSAAIQKGVARGVFSNEAGLGSAPIAHSASNCEHPAQQALWGIFEVFVDSFVVCTCTGLAILCSGAWTSNARGIDMTILAFRGVFPRFAPVFISFCVCLFAFTSIIGWAYYGETCLRYLFPKADLSAPYRVMYVLFTGAGALISVDSAWALSEIFSGLMLFPNLFALILLAPVVKKTTFDYLNRRKF